MVMAEMFSGNFVINLGNANGSGNDVPAGADHSQQQQGQLCYASARYLDGE